MLDWDFAIVSAFQTIEAYTDQNGIFTWHKEDPEERIGALRKLDPFQQDVDSITNAPKYKRANGEYFIPDVRSGRSDGEMWTYLDWMAAKQEDGKIE